MKKVLKNKKGFTLVELMVVVAILGVLVAVAVPAYNGITDSASEKVCAANIRTIESAILQAQVDGVKFTANNAAAITCLQNAKGKDNVTRTYLTNIDELKCPFDSTVAYTLKIVSDTDIKVNACGHGK